MNRKLRNLRSWEEGKVEESWDWALSENTCVPRCERTRGARRDICLPARIKRQMAIFSGFVKGESSAREGKGSIPVGWRTLCALSSSGYFLYAPRWTFPIFYFGERFQLAFSGLSGLDIGARVSRDADDAIQKTPLRLPSENPILRETFLPHWKHYENLGASMRAMDVLRDPLEPRVELGDARLLMFPTGSFDFLTIPMLLGPGNPCSTILEIVVCLREMWRVLKASGFVYIADGTLHPSVCYSAELAGFAVAYSKDRANGIPIGTFLLKHSDSAISMLARFPCLPALPPITLSPTSSEIVSHCNLIDDPETPVVRPGSLKCVVA